ncbi:hypothetical protein FI667_g4359, partial [Globisporangium splendens]
MTANTTTSVGIAQVTQKSQLQTPMWSWHATVSAKTHWFHKIPSKIIYKTLFRSKALLGQHPFLRHDTPSLFQPRDCSITPRIAVGSSLHAHSISQFESVANLSGTILFLEKRW